MNVVKSLEDLLDEETRLWTACTTLMVHSCRLLASWELKWP